MTRVLKITVDAGFGFSPIVCSDFGWPMPNKPGPKTVQAKLEGARNSQETRKLGTPWERVRERQFADGDPHSDGDAHPRALLRPWRHGYGGHSDRAGGDACSEERRDH
jgi:hypothetical protein